VTLFTVFT